MIVIIRGISHRAAGGCHHITIGKSPEQVLMVVSSAIFLGRTYYNMQIKTN
jgi:hypothetical protein